MVRLRSATVQASPMWLVFRPKHSRGGQTATAVRAVGQRTGRTTGVNVVEMRPRNVAASQNQLGQRGLSFVGQIGGLGNFLCRLFPKPTGVLEIGPRFHPTIASIDVRVVLLGRTLHAIGLELGQRTSQ